MTEREKYLKISELSEISGIGVSKIRYYIKKGVIPKPIKVSKNRAYYTQAHIKSLSLIAKMASRKKLTAIIKEVMDMGNNSNAGKKIELPNEIQIARRRIIHASVNIFKRQGYEGTTISDIAKAARISRNTMYKYFKNKRELFIAALMDTILEYFEALPEGPKQFDESDKIEAMRRRLSGVAQEFLRAYPIWSDMMNLLRAEAVKDSRTFLKKLDEAYETRIKLSSKDLGELSERGLIRKIDPIVTALILAGALEYINYYIYRGKFQKKNQEIMDEFANIMLFGLVGKP